MTRISLVGRGALAGAALLAAASAALAPLAAPAAGAATPAAEARPEPGTCPRVLVRTAELVRTVDGPAILVTGAKPRDTELRLEAEDVVYIRQPEHWNYFVVGCGGSGAAGWTRFAEVFAVPTDPVGSIGITVNGIPLDLP